MFTVFVIGQFFQHQAQMLCREMRQGRLITWGTAEDWSAREYTAGRAQPWRDVRATDALFTADEGNNVFLIWNGTMPHLLPIVEAARAGGLRPLFVENGFFPQCQQWDPDGVNAGSTAARLPAAAFAGLPTDPQIWRTLFAQRPVEHTAAEPPLRGDLEELPTRYAFLPLQLATDTQITRYSRFRSMRAVVEEVAAVLPDGLRLVVKEHPSAPTRDGSTALLRDFPEVIFTRYRRIDELLLGAACCVTVNSSVGLQALCRRVPVIVLGEAIYARPEWCQLADTPAALAAALRGYGDYPVRLELLGPFLTWLRDRWSMPWQYPAMVQRIGQTDAGARPWLEGLAC